MATFRDSNGKEWSFNFDAFNLDEIRTRTGIDVVDISAGGLAKLAADDVSVVKVLAVVFERPLREFATTMTGEAIEAGRVAIEAAAANFTPRKRWSELQSNLTKRRIIAKQMMDLKSALEEMPEGMQKGAIETVVAMMSGDSTTLSHSPEKPSAAGPGGTPSKLATDLPENAEQPPAD